MILDTTFCIDLLRDQTGGKNTGASKKLSALGEIKISIPIFVMCELHAGARLSSNPDTETAKINRLSEFIEVIYPSETFAVNYGQEEVALRQKGTPIPTMDLLIGTIAKYLGSPLLTRDIIHYKKINGLIVETY